MPLINAADLDTSPVENIIEGVVPNLGAGFLYGPSRHGKSLIAIEMGLAIGNGTPFFGHSTVQGSVAWCLGEGLNDAGIRIKARQVREQTDRASKSTATATPYSDEWLFVNTTPFMLPASPQLEPTMDLRRIVSELGQLPDLGLVILDAAADFTGLSLANDTSANRFMHGMRWMGAQLDCCVLAIAHPVESRSSKVNGLPGSRLFNSADFVMKIEPDMESTSDVTSATIVAEKMKGGPLFDSMAYTIEPVHWEQPPTDPVTNEEILGVPLITVKSATVRLREDELAGTGGLRMPGTGRHTAAPLPRALPVPPRSGKRNGVKRRAPGRPLAEVTGSASALYQMGKAS